MQRKFRRGVLLSVILILCFFLETGFSEEHQGWTVFRSVNGESTLDVPMTDNLLINASLGEGGVDTFTGWNSYHDGYDVDELLNYPASIPGRSARLNSTVPSEMRGLWQRVVLNQSDIRAIYFGGYSRAEGVTGSENSDYAIFLDVTYQDGDKLWAQTATFPVGNHEWVYRSNMFVPEKPVYSINYYLLFRNNHTGTVWFDNLTLKEALVELSSFDGQIVEPTNYYPYGNSQLHNIETDDGMQLSFASEGGAITSVVSSGGAVEEPGSVYASGFFVKDMANDSDFIHPGGTVSENGTGLIYSAADSGLDINLQAELAGHSNMIEADIYLSQTSSSLPGRSLRLSSVVANEARGMRQPVILDQSEIRAIYFGGYSRAEGVTGSENSDYSIYLDVEYQDGTYLWHQIATFPAGNSGWLYRNNTFVPEKPIFRIQYYLLFRNNHTGTVWFDNLSLNEVKHDGSLSPNMLVNPALEEGGTGSITGWYPYGKGYEVDTSVFIPGTDRALTLYFALPISAEGWEWSDDIRTSEIISGNNKEMSDTVAVGFGANGQMSHYPFASLSGTDGIALGYPIDHPAAVRIAANPVTSQFYLAFDVALSPFAKVPGAAHLKAVIYRYDPAWKFRAAAKKYYELYPDLFEKRVDEEGIWVAFSDLSLIPDIEDFGIAFHEANFSDAGFDYSAGIQTFRYLTSPGSYWMPMPVELDNTDPVVVMDYLSSLLSSPDPQKRQGAEATLSSGSIDEYSDYRFEGTSAPWCSHCAAFTVNPDPDISDPDYPLNKAHFTWNEIQRSVYDDTGGGLMAGEYIDSFERKSTLQDYWEIHISASDLPLVFNSETFRPVVPEVFGIYEFSKWLAEDIHGLEKLMMANGILWKFAFPAHVFDIMGRETNWLPNGVWSPTGDTEFNFKRTLSYQKPFCMLMNTDFSLLTHDLVERYFRTTLFYGVYPSMFSHNAYDDRYWDDPVLFERDRDLFRKYIPLIRTLGEAGWEPVTYAASSIQDIYVERYGVPGSLYLTTRNSSDGNALYELTIDAESLGLSESHDATVIDLITDTAYTAFSYGANLVLSDSLEPDEVRLFQVCDDQDGDGYAIDSGPCGTVDCDDNDSSANPGHDEICDGKDNNCDGVTDEGFDDNDSDGIKDCVDPDDDNDGLTDDDEINIYSTDPLNPDTDGDGSNDGEEIQSGTLPLHPDTDRDGILDGQDIEPLNIFSPNPQGWKISKNSDFSTSDTGFSTSDTFNIIVWSNIANAEPMKKKEYKIKNTSGDVHKEDLAGTDLSSVYKENVALSGFSTGPYTVEVWLRDNNNVDYEKKDIFIELQ